MLDGGAHAAVHALLIAEGDGVVAELLHDGHLAGGLAVDRQVVLIVAAGEAVLHHIGVQVEGDGLAGLAGLLGDGIGLVGGDAVAHGGVSGGDGVGGLQVILGHHSDVAGQGAGQRLFAGDELVAAAIIPGAGGAVGQGLGDGLGEIGGAADVILGVQIALGGVVGLGEGGLVPVLALILDGDGGLGTLFVVQIDVGAAELIFTSHHGALAVLGAIHQVIDLAAVGDGVDLPAGHIEAGADAAGLALGGQQGHVVVLTLIIHVHSGVAVGNIQEKHSGVTGDHAGGVAAVGAGITGGGGHGLHMGIILGAVVQRHVIVLEPGGRLLALGEDILHGQGVLDLLGGHDHSVVLVDVGNVIGAVLGPGGHVGAVVGDGLDLIALIQGEVHLGVVALVVGVSPGQAGHTGIALGGHGVLIVVVSDGQILGLSLVQGNGAVVADVLIIALGVLAVGGGILHGIGNSNAVAVLGGDNTSVVVIIRHRLGLAIGDHVVILVVHNIAGIGLLAADIVQVNDGGPLGGDDVTHSRGIRIPTQFFTLLLILAQFHLIIGLGVVGAGISGVRNGVVIDLILHVGQGHGVGVLLYPVAAVGDDIIVSHDLIAGLQGPLALEHHIASGDIVRGCGQGEGAAGNGVLDLVSGLGLNLSFAGNLLPAGEVVLLRLRIRLDLNARSAGGIPGLGITVGQLGSVLGNIAVVHILHAVHGGTLIDVDQLVSLSLIGHIQAVSNIIPVGIHIIGVIRLIQGRGHIQVLDVLVVGIQSLGGGIHVQIGIAIHLDVVRDRTLEEGVGLLHILADVLAIFVHKLLSQIGHLIVSGGDGEVGGVSGLIAILLNAILEISGIVQLDTGVVAVFLVGVQLHVIGILDRGIVERILIGGGPAQGAAIGVQRNAALDGLKVLVLLGAILGAAADIGHLIAHGVHDHGGDAGGQLGKGGVQRFGILGVDILAVALDHPFQVLVVHGKAHSVHVAVEVSQLFGAVVTIIILAVGQEDQHLLGHGALILIQQVDTQVYTLHDVGAAIGNHIVQAGFRLGTGGKRDVLNVSAVGQIAFQSAHSALRCTQATGIRSPLTILGLFVVASCVTTMRMVFLIVVPTGQLIVGTTARIKIPKKVIFTPTMLMLRVGVRLQLVAAVAVTMGLFRTPGHGAGLIQDEHHIQGLLLDGGVADVGLYGDLPLGVAHPLGGLAQGDVVAVVVSARPGLEGVVLLAIGGEGADLDQAEGHDHSHEQGQTSAAKALERMRSFLQSFVSHYFVLLLIFCNRNGILAAGLAWRSALAPMALRPALSGGLPWSVFLVARRGRGRRGILPGSAALFHPVDACQGAVQQEEQL